MLSVQLQIPPSSYFAFPYTVALLMVLLVIAILFWRRPGLREYHRKRNAILYAAILVIILALSLQISSVSSRALIDYSLGSTSNKLYAETPNQLAISTTNHGGRPISFCIMVRAQNASFQAQPQNYNLLDDKTAKVPFQLQGSPSSQNKLLTFRIDRNVSSFEFSTSFEADILQSVTVMSGTTSIQFNWNATEGCYVPGSIAGFVV